MKVLMLGREKHRNIFITVGRIMQLEKVKSEKLYFDNCTEMQLVKSLRNADLFLFFPDCLSGNKSEDGLCMLETVAAGYVLAKKGRVLIFSQEKKMLSEILGAEPVVGSIGETIGYFRRERKVFESNKVFHNARRLISESSLSFSSRGLVEAVEYGMYREVQAFLKVGFSTETENDEGVPLLSLAVRNGDLEICRLLMSYGASLNLIARDRCTSPIMDAVTAMKTEVAELLIDAGADLNFKNRNGQTSLVVAIGARMEKLADLLVDKGADITVKDSLGMTAADYAKLFSLKELQQKIEAKL